MVKKVKKIYGPYDQNNPEHQALVKFWFDRSKLDHLSYLNAIYTWTKNDIRKRKAAKNNNLNWIEFFSMDEFMAWFEKQ